MEFQYDIDSIKVFDNFFEESTRDQIFKYLQRPTRTKTSQRIVVI
jgi:predicted transcriptional regulator